MFIAYRTSFDGEEKDIISILHYVVMLAQNLQFSVVKLVYLDYAADVDKVDKYTPYAYDHVNKTVVVDDMYRYAKTSLIPKIFPTISIHDSKRVITEKIEQVQRSLSLLKQYNGRAVILKYNESTEPFVIGLVRNKNTTIWKGEGKVAINIVDNIDVVKTHTLLCGFLREVERLHILNSIHDLTDYYVNNDITQIIDAYLMEQEKEKRKNVILNSQLFSLGCQSLWKDFFDLIYRDEGL